VALMEDRAFLESRQRLGDDGFDGMGARGGAGRSPGPPLAAPVRGKTGSSGSSTPVFHYVLPWLMFVLISMLFTYGYHHIPGLVWSTVCLCSCFSLIFMFTTSGEGAEGRSAVSLGVLCVFAIVLSVLAGLHNYGTNMEQYWMYEEAREYHNVLPSEPAAAHADAGKITFAEAARIDTTKAVGYKAASTYCVAPILDPSSNNRVEFWAVGLDCCAPRGEFNCDDAAKEGAEAAHGGIVVFETGWIAATHFEYFRKAVKESEAANDLVSAAEPIFVRWVKDPASVQASFFAAGTGALFGYCILHLVANTLLALLSTALRGMGR